MEKEIKIVTDYSVCALCKGACCQSMPASYHPEDFERIFDEKISTDLLVKIFNSGIVAVDWWEDDPRNNGIVFDDQGDIVKEEGHLDECYYLRPKGIHALDKLRDPTYRDNPCIHWNIKTGCQLDEFHRPYGCRTLVPDKANFPYGCNYKKEANGDKQAMAIAWIPYQKMIEEAIEIFDQKN